MSEIEIIEELRTKLQKLENERIQSEHYKAELNRKHEMKMKSIESLAEIAKQANLSPMELGIDKVFHRDLDLWK